MKARRVVAGVFGAGAMLFAGQVAASANIAWCMDDPPIQVQTAGGTNVTVNTKVYVPQSESGYLSSMTESATTAPDGAGGTLITVSVNLPAGITTARVVASVNRTKLSASASATGTGGQTLILHLDVPTS